MNRRSRLMGLTALAMALVLAIPAGVAAKGAGGGGKPGGETTAANNLSFPAIAVDGFAITPLTSTAFTTPYAGSYPALTADEIAYLQANGPWYAQKVTENQWQAEYQNTGQADVTYIDWSDNMESVSPKLRSPFRIEMVLFKQLDMPMTAYSMGVLEYPSSANELQGANTTTYASNYATVISARPKLVVQYFGTTDATTLTWDATHWDGASAPEAITFAPELNVGGKYVFGASSGGWKPTQAGSYRITFYVPTGSGVNLATATIANESTGFTAPTEGVATAVLDAVNNLTYLDVLVTSSGGGGRR